MRSERVLIASLDVCNRDTMIAEYDVVKNKLRTNMKINIILDETFFGTCKASENTQKTPN